MRIFAAIFGVVLGVSALAACGSPDNVGACKEWLEKTSCGTFDFKTLVNCEVFKDQDCDVTDYFDCLTANTKCNNGTPDYSGWMTCQSKATCS